MKGVALCALAGVAAAIRPLESVTPLIPNSFEHAPATTHAHPHFSNGGSEQSALEFLSVVQPGLQFNVLSTAPSKKSTHVYLQQKVNGLRVVNANANINLDAQHKVRSYGHALTRKTVDFVPPRVQAAQALNNLMLRMELAGELPQLLSQKSEYEFLFTGGALSLDDIPVHLVYVVVDGELELGWEFVARIEERGERPYWYNGVMSSSTTDLLSVVDWVHEYESTEYNAYPIGVNDPEDGERSFLENPYVGQAGLSDWHYLNGGNTTDTRGNNVYAQENLDGSSDWVNNYRPQGTVSDGGSKITFDYPIDFSQEPETYLDASITNLFVWNNLIHDVFQAYGFDEASGNFQEDNYGRGGAGNDAVQANAQDGAGYNNANFATPADGSRPRMRMYLWNSESPMVDGDFDNGIIIHEYAHGISNRLTGGRTNVGCLPSGQAGGMGEGWGDLFATMLRWRSEYTYETSFGMGDYANRNGGIRTYNYSTSTETNPHIFSDADLSTSVHFKGSVWCNILFNIFQDLMRDFGFEADWYNVGSDAGNIVFLQNVVDGMKFQPCNPNFVQARDAILEAESANYGNKHECAMWVKFAEKGLGVDASFDGSRSTDSFDLPPQCL